MNAVSIIINLTMSIRYVIDISVVEAPTEAYLNPLLANEELSKLQSKEERRVQVVVHFTPKSIMDHPKYQEWLNR